MVTWIGTPGSDVRRGTDAADHLWGRAGNDELSGLGGDDFLYGEIGNDTLRGGAGSDRLYGEIYNPPAGGGGSRPPDPAGRNDSLYGEAGNDFLNGGVRDDLLDGGTGNDKLNGWTGSDTLYGGDGDDELDAGAEGDNLFPLNYSLIDKLYGGAGNDTLIGRTGKDLLDGGAGDDDLQGGGDADHLMGGAGNDILDGGWWYGNVLEGGSGDDYYRVYYSAIEDVSSNVIELPGGGVDTVESRGDHPPLDGEDLPEIENFIIRGGFDGEIVFNGNAHDNQIRVYDGTNNWHILGLAGDDVLYGSNGISSTGLTYIPGEDWLEGGDGNDRLIGGWSSDRLNGGAGRDDFQFNRPSDSSIADGGRGIDRIDDFKVGLDDLVFSGSFDADTTVAGRQKLSFIGESDTPGRGQLAYQHEDGDTLLVANLDNDPDAEFQVQIVGLAPISAGDVLIF
jgi:Ca2+-binding RTX toxin-like protein